MRNLGSVSIPWTLGLLITGSIRVFAGRTICRLRLSTVLGLSLLLLDFGLVSHLLSISFLRLGSLLSLLLGLRLRTLDLWLRVLLLFENSRNLTH